MEEQRQRRLEELRREQEEEDERAAARNEERVQYRREEEDRKRERRAEELHRAQLEEEERERRLQALADTVRVEAAADPSRLVGHTKASKLAEVSCVCALCTTFANSSCGDAARRSSAVWRRSGSRPWRAR